MSSEENTESSAEKSLMTLDQLSQTIEVMTGVVNRLKRHLSLQLSLTSDLTNNLTAEPRNNVMATENPDLSARPQPAANSQECEGVAERRSSFIVEISRLDGGIEFDQDHTLH